MTHRDPTAVLPPSAQLSPWLNVATGSDESIAQACENYHEKIDDLDSEENTVLRLWQLLQRDIEAREQGQKEPLFIGSICVVGSGRFAGASQQLGQGLEDDKIINTNRLIIAQTIASFIGKCSVASTSSHRWVRHGY
jgi:hypothetical protein